MTATIVAGSFTVLFVVLTVVVYLAAERDVAREVRTAVGSGLILRESFFTQLAWGGIQFLFHIPRLLVSAVLALLSFLTTITLVVIHLI